MVEEISKNGVQGFLHRPAKPNGMGLALAHGANFDAKGGLVTRVAEAFEEAGVMALRYNLPFRQKQPTGPPSGLDRCEAVRAFPSLILFEG